VKCSSSAKTSVQVASLFFQGERHISVTNLSTTTYSTRSWTGWGYGYVTVHGFRATFKTWSEEKTNFPTRAIEFALAHGVPNDVEASYFRSTLFEKRQELMECWSQFITSPGAQVVRFRA
jgi:integrase